MGELITGAVNLVDKLDPVSRNLTGSKGLDIFGTGKDAEDAKKEQKRVDAIDAANGIIDTSTATATPDGPASNLSRDLLNTQNKNRRNFLLRQSTGRSPQGPQIEQIQQNRSLF